MARIGPRPTMYKMETFKVAVLFLLLWKKRRRRKRKAYTLSKRYFFIRTTKEANSVCSMFEHESFHHNFQSCQVWLYCSARLDRQRRQSDLCTSCHYQVKRRHVIGQTLRCLREIRTWFNSRVALRALRSYGNRPLTNGNSIRPKYVRCMDCVSEAYRGVSRSPSVLTRMTLGSRTAWVVSIVPWRRTPWVVAQMWRGGWRNITQDVIQSSKLTHTSAVF